MAALPGRGLGPPDAGIGDGRLDRVKGGACEVMSPAIAAVVVVSQPFGRG